ncbi:SIR2 family protein [Algibacter sp. L3A6]|uniref:SIR2 family protein n=1 Tax=Algibacter sp. L3A6 TaxID=2686366 RepID=UPI00131E2538|nr:SIR2 family protein [Algibacter sp. L3A6]
MKYLYLNGKKSVAIKLKAGTTDEIENVLINGSEHDFKDEKNPNKLDYAIKSKRNMYEQFLNNQFENLSVLTGAGSSVGIGDTNKGRLLSQLWEDVKEKLTEATLNRFCDLVEYQDVDKEGVRVKNLEKLLSIANIAKNYIKDESKDDKSPINIEGIITIIETVIKDKCTITLPKNSPHKDFLDKITKRKVTAPRIKVFTLNYDTLFEQAARNSNYTIIDGFSFSIPRKFSGRNFDYDIVSRNSSRVKEEDNFINKVFHLYKPHGSIDWESKGDDIYQKDSVKDPLMIYPKDSKYESSYDQPYFEMMSRFQQSLRNDNVLLICIGFSFNDKHIVSAIIEALEQNPSFQLMVVNKGIDDWSDSFNPFFEAAKKYNNIALVDETFVDFAEHYPDLKSYNHEDSKKIIINNNISSNV